MAPGLEPAFTPDRPVWPLAGVALANLEPDDPDLAIPFGALRKGVREAPERYFAANQNGLITQRPLEPLAPRQARADTSRKWKLALLASCIFHAAVAHFFLQATDEAVLMEGADFSGIAYQGSAMDQSKAGEATEETTVDITMVTMLDATPVETVNAEAVPVDDHVEAIDVAEAVVADIETLKPVEETPVEPAAEPRVEPVRPVERVEAEPVENSPAPAVTQVAPQVLATDRVEPANDDNIVQQSVEAPVAEPVGSEATPTANPHEASKVETAEVAKAEPTETNPVDEVKPRPEVAKKAEQPKPARKPATEKKAAPSAKAAERTAEKPKKAGSGGQNAAEARRGQADGQEKGDSRQASRGGSKNGEVGNAAVSNYPGKVRSKLARVARSVRAKGSGEVVVAFAVGANGGVRSARVARSSGVDSVDQAALQAVKKASPFPPIPANAGRATWEFSVPLAFRR